tara:strand:+ start:58 stop:1452 length:1395 start_codon:yes stop_codon:yes gene_type:complete
MAGQFNIAGSVANGSITTAKLADDAVDNDKLADSIVAAIAANTAKTTNATHTGDVTGSTSLTIANDAVTTTKIADGAVTDGKIGAGQISVNKLANGAVHGSKIADQAVTLDKLPHGTSSNDGKFLRANNGADPSFETVSSDVVNDTTPQLGGNLDTNGSSIAFGDSNNDAVASGNVNRLKFGAGTDMVMYHNGTDNFLKNPNGNLKIFTGADKQSIIAEPNAGVKLYYNDEKKLETTAQGADVQAEGSAVELRLKTDGGTLRGYVYGNNSNEFGFLDANGNWPIKNTLNTKTEFSIGSTKKVTIDSDGIKFGSNTGAAYALDDYEEGSYTPKVGRSTSNYVKNSGYNTQQGTYTKIGRLVHATMQIYIATGGFGGTGYYWIPVSGLPFAPQADTSGCLSEACSMVLSRLYIFSSDRAGGTNAMTFKMQSAGNLLLKSIKDNSWHTSGEGNTIVINGTITYYTAT